MTILLEKITKYYEGRAVLNNFTIEIEWDKCYAIIGPEGSGKTTILKIFMGTEEPDEGGVHRMGDYKYPTLQSAYIPQESSFKENKNAVWNVRKAHRWAGKKNAMDLLSNFLAEDRQLVPVSELTEVEKRYVEIAKAFITTADFLVFDEPFKGMNSEEKKKALDFIMKERGSRPLIIASRDEIDYKFDKIRHI